MVTGDQALRQVLAVAWLSGGGGADRNHRALMSETAHWVVTGQWPGEGQPAQSPTGGLCAPAGGGVRALQPGTVAAKALSYFQGLIDRGEPLRGNPAVARALGIPNPDSEAAGRRASQILSRLAKHQGWIIRHKGCAASGNFFRRIEAADGTNTPWADDYDSFIAPQQQPSWLGEQIKTMFDEFHGMDAVEKVREVGDAPAPAQSTSTPTPALAVIDGPDDTSAGDVPGDTIRVSDSHDGPVVEVAPSPLPARIPEVDHVTAQADTGFAPDAAGAPLGVAPAQGGGWPGGVVRDGARHMDHCATLAVEIIEAGEVLPSLKDCLARLKARYNGSWSACGDVASVSGCFTALKRLGFCTIATRPEYPIAKGAPHVRQVTLWDGRVSALPPLPAPKPTARPITHNMAAANARRAAEAAVVNPAGTRRKDRLAAILLRCVEAQEPVPSNVEIGRALDMPPNKTPDILAMLEADGLGRMEHSGSGWTLRRRYVLRDGRSTPWSPPRNRAQAKGAAPKPVTARAVPASPAPVSPPPAAPAPIVAAGPKAAAPNINTGLYDRRPAPAARIPAGKDVSPELRAEIERRVAEGRFTRADKPGYAAPTDATATGVPVYSTAGGNRRPSY